MENTSQEKKQGPSAGAPSYDVVSPAGMPAATRIEPAAPLTDLNGKKIGLVWTVFSNGNVLLEAFRDLLKQRYPDINCLEFPPGKGLRWGDYPDASLPEAAREAGLDAAIVTMGC